MLETDMKEKQEKVMTISDLDKEVVSDMLTFLYTGSAPNIEVRAKELLNAASKYQLTSSFDGNVPRRTGRGN